MSQVPGTVQVDAQIRLVPRSVEDAVEMFALIDRHRAELRSWLSWVDVTNSVSDARRYAEVAQAQFAAEAGFDYALRRSEELGWSEELVGSIGLYRFDRAAASAEIGYWLAPPARGRGIMTRAVAALCTHAFDAMRLHRLEIHCVTENHASRAVAERLDFRFEGIRRQAYLLHGAFRDLALYAMLAAEWPPQRDASPLSR